MATPQRLDLRAGKAEAVQQQLTLTHLESAVVLQEFPFACVVCMETRHETTQKRKCGFLSVP